MKSLKNGYKRRRTRLFIGRNGGNRPIDAFNPHQRSRLSASIRNGKVKSPPSDLHWMLQIDPRDVRYKTHETAPVGSQSNAPYAFDRVKSWPL